MGDLDDFGELYADLEDKVISGVAVAELEKGEKSEPVETGAGCEDEVMLSWSSSDSEDDLQIVLNEEDYPNKLPPQLIAKGRDCEEDEGDDDLVIVAGPDCSRKEPMRAEQGLVVDGLPLGSGDRGITMKGVHRNCSRQYSFGSAVRARNPSVGRGHWDHLTVPDSLSNASYSFGFPMAFSNACDFYLPRNRSIFDIDMESFECKPWRFIGVDITDYFNFGLDEEGWKSYCKQLVHFQQNKLPMHESSRLNQPGEVAAEVCDDGLSTIPDYLDKERKGIPMPKGRAIQVESGNLERIPSVDVRRMRNRDSEVVIQITTGLAVEDASDPIIVNQVDESGTKGDLLLSSKKEPCKISFSVDTFAQKCERSVHSSDCHQPDSMKCGKSSPSRDVSSIKPDAIFADHHSNSTKTCDHNDPFEASIDGVFVEKVSSPECRHLDSDSWLQESVFSDCYPSSATGSGMSKTDHTTYGDDSPDSQDQNFRQPIPHNVGKMNASSDDGVAAPHCRQRKDGEHKTNTIGTIVRNLDTELDERDHSAEDDKILSKNSIKDFNKKEANTTFIEYSKKVHDEDLSPIRHKKKISTTTDVKTRQNDGYTIRMAQHNRRTRNIVNRDYFQASSENMSLNDKRNVHFCRRSRRVDEHDLRMEANHDSMAAKYQQRERSFDECRGRSLDEYSGRCVPYLYEKNKRFLDEYERVPCSVGKVRRNQQLHNYHSNLNFGLERSGRYVDDCEDSRFHEGGLHRRSYRDEYGADQRGWHDDGPQRNQIPRFFYKKHMSHSGYSDARETFFNLNSKHCTVSSKECHHFSSKTSFKFNDDHFPAEPMGICPNNSAYDERGEINLALPGLLTREEVIRHQDSINLCSRKRNTIYGTLQHENDRVDNKSFSDQKTSNENIYANHRQDGIWSKLNGRNCKDSDSGFPLGSPSDKFVKNKHELAYRGCIEAVGEHLDGWKGKSKRRRTKSGGLVRTDNAAYKESRESMDNEQLSHYSVTLTDNHFCLSYKEGRRECRSGYGNNIMNKSSNAYVIPQEEIEELEEGQLVEESDNHETAVIKCTYDANSVIPSKQLSKDKKDLTDLVQRNKLVGGYDRNHLLETLAKMEKRQERFRNPILLKKEQENCGNMQPDTATEDEVKQQRPARKRRWGSS